MRETLLHFAWPVNPGAYRWVKASRARSTSEPEPFITDDNAYGDDDMYSQRAAPLEDTALFQRFASLPPEPEAILDFVNQFGLLGGAFTAPISLQLETGSTYICRGESLAGWKAEIAAMKAAVDLWGSTTSARPTPQLLKRLLAEAQPHVAQTGITLGDIFGRSRPHTAQEAEEFGPPEPPNFDEEQPPKEVFNEWARTGELFPAAAYNRSQDIAVLKASALNFVQRIINYRLREGISPRLHLDRDRMRLQFVPHSLVGALWLQFARAVDGNTTFSQCSECHKWFEVSPDAARTNRRFCSDACRARAYRGRQAKARRLLSEGTSMEEIANSLDTDVETVRGWVSDVRARKQ